MPTIVIGTTSKKLNSTSHSFSGTSLSCNLKNNCGMQSPVFEVQGLTKGVMYNYASFENRYYWVTDVIYLTNNIQEVHCSLDALATYKTAITNTYAMVAYGDEAHWNKTIDDIRVEPELRYTAVTIGDANIFNIDTSTTGCIAMTFTSTTSVNWITGDSSTAGTGVHTAIMDMENMRQCIGDLTGFDPGQGLTGAGMLEMLEAFGRVIQSLGGGSIADYIQRIIWLPFDMDDLLSKIPHTQYLGMFIGGVLADQCVWHDVGAGAIYTTQGDFSVDWDSITNNHDFMKNQRWISLQMYTPGGYQSLPVQYAKYSNKLYYKTAFSITDGSWCCRICSDANRYDTLTTFSGNVSVDQLGTVNLGNTWTGALADAGASFVGQALSMGISSVAHSATTFTTTSATESAGEYSYNKNNYKSEGVSLSQTSTNSGIQGDIPRTNFSVQASSGSIGGAASLFLTTNPARLIIRAQVYMPYTLSTYEDYCDNYGYPCNQYLKLGNLSGYIRCAGATVSGAAGATSANLSTINSYLNSGFYLE